MPPQAKSRDEAQPAAQESPNATATVETNNAPTNGENNGDTLTRV